jgi:hypothetical protein
MSDERHAGYEAREQADQAAADEEAHLVASLPHGPMGARDKERPRPGKEPGRGLVGNPAPSVWNDIQQRNFKTATILR